MFNNIFFLSIYDQYASMILNGEKNWEFRKNHNFGIQTDWQLTVGDFVFLVSTFPNTKKHPEINCMCRILEILRDKSFNEYFCEKESGNWKESGCDDNTDRDWNFFVNNILNVHSTAIRFEVFPVCPTIDVSTIRHQTKQSSWNGRGLTPAKGLHRYLIENRDVFDYFNKLASQILSGK